MEASLLEVCGTKINEVNDALNSQKHPDPVALVEGFAELCQKVAITIIRKKKIEIHI